MWKRELPTRNNDLVLESDVPKPKEFVASLAKGLSILSAFDVQNAQMTLTEVADRVGMTRATARRFLLTLESLGYLGQEKRKFHLTPKVLNLGYAFMASVPVLDVISPVLEELTAKTGLVSAFAIINDDEIVNLAHGSISKFFATGQTIGSSKPAYCTASGRAILSNWDSSEVDAYLERVKFKPLTPYTITDPEELKTELAKTKQRGYSLVDQEAEIGIRVIAVPIFDSSKNLIGSIFIVANPALISIEQLELDYLPHLQQAAYKIQERALIYA